MGISVLYSMEASFLRLLCVLIVTLLSSALAIVFFGITKNERIYYVNLINHVSCVLREHR